MNLCASERRGIGGYLRVFSSNRTKSSTMSHCLHIDEILRKVVLEIYAYGGLRTLRNLAITCTAFREPALDELWHRQSSLAPLIQCLPGHLWAVVPRVIDDWTNESTTVKILYELKFVQRVTPSDWTAALSYLRRVKVFDQTSSCYMLSDPPLIPPRTLTVLRVFAPTLPLFPNLRRLVLCTEMMRVADMFLSSGLAWCRLVGLGGGASHSVDWDSSAAFICLTCTSLAVLCINECPEISFAIAPRLTAWDSLRVLSISALKAEEMAAVAALPNLRTLKLFSLRIEGLLLTRQGAFHALRSLTIHAEASSTVAALIRLLPRGHGLEFVDAYEYQINASTLQGWKILTEALAEHVSPASLTHIKMTSCPCTMGDLSTNLPLPLPSIAEELRPLLSFGALEVVCIMPRQLPAALRVDSGLDDAMLIEMSLAWPHLREFNVLPVDTPSEATMRGVVHLILGCRNLQVLKVPAVLTVDPTTEVPSDYLPNMSFHDLMVVDAFDVEAAYKYLAPICPNLELTKLRSFPVSLHNSD